MKTPAKNSREIVDRFLGKLGEPLSPLQAERSLERVRNRLDDAEALHFSTIAPRMVSSFRWSAVAAAIVAMLIGGAVQVLFLRPIPGGMVAKAAGGQVYFSETYSPLSIASRIEGGQAIRSGSEGGAIALLDGSRIEMSPRAELSIVHASDGMRVRLASGTVIVTAAKQRQGHLYVETKDLLVSVVGTVFSVSSEAVGSRVSVIEGEVHVQQGQTVQTLLPGQQASTSPVLGPLPVETELGWSKSAVELIALLQQSTPVIPIPVQAAVPQPTSRGVQGSVKSPGKQEGIAGATVTACPMKGQGAEVLRQFRIPADVADGEIALVLRNGEVVKNAPIIKNKTFFFALWDGAAGCPNPIQGKTDATGHFQLPDLAPGDYVVRAQLEGYLGPAANGTYPTFASQQVTVGTQQPAPEMSLSLVRSGSISGRVRDAEGKLLVNASVSAGVSAPANGTFVISTSKTTDDRGEYRLFGLPPGEYYVRAGRRAAAEELASAAEALAGVVRFKFSVGRTFGDPGQVAAPATGQTFFPNAASLSEAMPVVLKEGDEVTGIDIVMRPPVPSDAPVRPGLVPYLRK